MKRTLLASSTLLVFTISCTSLLFAQQDSKELPNPWQHTQQKLQQGNYLSILIDFRKQEPRYLASKWKDAFCEFMGTINSFVGNYYEAILYFDKRREQNYYPPDFQSSLDSYEPLGALQVIHSIADSHQVIFINEAHHVPLHRAFSIHLLKVLYDKGFRYFAAETLNEIDKELNNRKYPLSHLTGWYTDEPVYGDLVRNALRLGFKVVPYEHIPPCYPREDSASYWQNQRERGQAENLYNRILINDPTAKIFVHAGYGHIAEKGIDKWIPMAKYFKEITGIDPFTIDQQKMTEHSSPEYEQGDYRYALEKGLITEPTIFKSKSGELWVQELARGRYDVQIFHPRTRYQNGRPHWLLLDGARKPYWLKKDVYKGISACLVQAFINDEEPNAVPIDQIEISDTRKVPALMLPKGEMRIKVVDKTGEVINEFSVNVN